MALLLAPGPAVGAVCLSCSSRQGQPSTSGPAEPLAGNWSPFLSGGDLQWRPSLAWKSQKRASGARALVEKNANSEPFFMEKSDESERPGLVQETSSGLLLPAAKELVNGTAQPTVLKPATSTSKEPTGHRAGLFRTPISGGVQSATTSHGLPSPAIAVRNLIEQARYAHLCTIMSRMHHRRKGYPFGSLVDYNVDPDGYPVFSLSPLAIHTRNILADPRCTLVVQIPGWSGLANARVTLFGDVYPLPQEHQAWAQQLHASKHHQGVTQQWGNFYFYRMDRISDIYFVGGFGTVAWVDVNDYRNAKPDAIIASSSSDTLQELNNKFSKPLIKLIGAEGGAGVDDVCIISIDSKGVDVRVRQGARFNVQRLSFDSVVETLDQATTALFKVIDNGPQH